MNCALYRHFDAYGGLLYVGVSLDLEARTAWHQKNSGWWPDVATTSVVWFPSGTEAMKAEALAIAKERPAHNKALNRPDEFSQFASAIGRKILTKQLGIGLTALNNAEMRGKIPCSWAFALAELCAEHDMTLSADLFDWRGNPDTTGKCITALFSKATP